ncbi:MAG: hypothetical protein RIF32_11080 [Leptospirales bacterium]|jgi:hypothetical protein
MKPSKWICAVCLAALTGGAAFLIPLSRPAAQPDRGPEDFDWGLDAGEADETKSGTDGEARTNGDSSAPGDAVPDTIRRRAAAQYVEFRNQRLRKNRLIRSELIRMGDKPLAKVYQTLAVPRRTLKRARGRIEAGLEALLVKISSKIESKQVITRVRLERVRPEGGQGSVLIHTPGPNGGSYDPVIFVYRVKSDGAFESDVIFRPGS